MSGNPRGQRKYVAQHEAIEEKITRIDTLFQNLIEKEQQDYERSKSTAGDRKQFLIDSATTTAEVKARAAIALARRERALEGFAADQRKLQSILREQEEDLEAVNARNQEMEMLLSKAQADERRRMQESRAAARQKEEREQEKHSDEAFEGLQEKALTIVKCQRELEEENQRLMEENEALLQDLEDHKEANMLLTKEQDAMHKTMKKDKIRHHKLEQQFKELSEIRSQTMGELKRTQDQLRNETMSNAEMRLAMEQNHVALRDFQEKHTGYHEKLMHMDGKDGRPSIEPEWAISRLLAFSKFVEDRRSILTHLQTVINGQLDEVKTNDQAFVDSKSPFFHWREALETDLAYVARGIKDYNHEATQLDETLAQLQVAENKAKLLAAAEKEEQDSVLNKQLEQFKGQVSMLQNRASKFLDRNDAQYRVRSLQKCFFQWKMFCTESKNEKKQQAYTNKINAEKNKRVMLMVMRGRVQGLAGPFSRLKEHARTQRVRKKAILNSCLKRMVNASVWTSWRHWNAMVEQSHLQQLQAKLASEKSKRAANLIKHWREHSMVPVFKRWKQFTANEKVRRKELLKRTMTHLVSGRQLSAWKHWNQTIERQKINALRDNLDSEKAKRVKNLINGWRMRSLVPAFKEWHTVAKASAARRVEITTKMLFRFQNGAIWRSWRVWTLYVKEEAERETESEIQKLKRQLDRNKQNAANALIKRWRQGTVTPVFKTWRTWAIRQGEHRRELTRKMLFRLANAQAFRVWRQWHQYVEEDKIASVQMEMNRRLAQLDAQAAYKQQNAIKNMMKRWQQNSLIPAFKEWRKWSVKNKAHRKELLTKTLTRLVNANLWTSWRAWSTCVHDAQIDQMRRLLDAEKAKLMADGEKNRALASSSIMKQWRKGTKTNIFQTWKAFARKSADRKRYLLETTLKRMCSASEHAAWRQWHWFVEHGKINALQEQLNQQKHRRAMDMIQRWRSKTLIPVFARWKHYSREQSKRRNDLTKTTLQRMVNHAIWRPWRRWKEVVHEAMGDELNTKYADQVAKMRHLLNAQKSQTSELMIMKHRYHLQVTCFSKWKIHTAKQKEREKTLLKQMLIRMSQGALWHSWRRWTKEVADKGVQDLMNENAELKAALAKQMETNTYLYKVIHNSVV